MALEFGIFDHQERRRDVPLDQQYRERLQFVAAADRLGFYAYHLTEHHNAPLCVSPSQSVFLAAAAQHSERLRLGSLVYLLPFYHPLRLIEEVCMLDQLTGGRLQIGIGRGVSPLEHQFWFNTTDEANERFEETFAILIAGLTHDRLSHEGKYYRFVDVPIELRPKQQPYPPFWYAGNAERAASLGMNFIGGGRIGRLAETAARFREVWASTPPAARVNRGPEEPKVGSSRHVYVAETDAEAEATARRAWQAYHLNFLKRGYERENYRNGGPSVGGDFDFALANEVCVAGSPATLRSYVERYAAESGCNYFVGAFQWGDLDHAEAMASLRLFATEVMPAVGAASE